MTFEEWFNRTVTEINLYTVKQAWRAGQQAERERIKKIVEQIIVQGDYNHELFDCGDTIIERISK